VQKKGPTVSELPEVFLMEPFLIFLQASKVTNHKPMLNFFRELI
jgi:hypothetical protein